MPESNKRKTLGILAIAGVEPYQEKPGEEYMSPDQLAHFTKILEAWRNQLREEVDRTVHHMQDEASNFPDPVDRASQEDEFSLELRNRYRCPLYTSNAADENRGVNLRYRCVIYRTKTNQKKQTKDTI